MEGLLYELAKRSARFLLAIGAAIFLVTSFSDEEISYDVEISETDVERLRDQWELQMTSA